MRLGLGRPGQAGQQSWAGLADEYVSFMGALPGLGGPVSHPLGHPSVFYSIQVDSKLESSACKVQRVLVQLVGDSILQTKLVALGTCGLCYSFIDLTFSHKFFEILIKL